MMFLVQMMQDWLTEQKLDRKLLANLTTNLANVEAYQHFCEAEVASVVRGLLREVAGDSESEPEEPSPAPDFSPKEAEAETAVSVPEGQTQYFLLDEVAFGY